MITAMLITHIILLTLSVLATTIMVLMSLASRRVSGTAQKINLIGTTVGISLGALLLIQHPIGSKCIELTAYVAIFAIAYYFIASRSHQYEQQTHQINR